MDLSDINTHSKTSVLKNLKYFLYKYYTKFTEQNKTKTNCASSSASLSQFFKLLYNCIPSIRELF